MTHVGGLTVLVSGASGFIGGRLLAALARDGDIRIRAASRVPRRWPSGVDGVVIDAHEPDTLLRACDGADVVVNLAAMSEFASATDPDGALRVNTGGTLSMVRAASRASVGRFVQVSTAKVYGTNARGVVSEETPTRPRSHYAITHRASEDYASLHPHAVILRLANGFGTPVGEVPGAWSVIVNDFCRQAVVDGCIVLQSDGRSWRNFVPMDDVTAAIGAACVALPAGTYNVGALRTMTLREMAERVAAVAESVVGARVRVRTGEHSSPDSEPMDYRTDRLRAAGVIASASMDAEIARTVQAAVRTFGRTRDV